MLTSDFPNDLDILVVYDPFVCPPQDAYSFHRETVLDLKDYYRLPVHVTLLTSSEESGTEFIKRTGAIDFMVAVRWLPHLSAGPT